MTRYDQFEQASLTDVGVRRSHNQDSLTVILAKDDESWRDQGHVFQVADGMGAHAVGEMASEIATRIIAHTYHKLAAEGVVQALKKAFTEANTTIHDKGQRNPEFQGMGTTSTALVLRPDGAWIGHVGDSRAYRIRGALLQQLSFDHSLHWEKAKRRNMRPEDLHGVPTNVIVRSLGPEAVVEADIQGPHPVQEGDIFLLCSDGLSGPLSDREIGAVSSVLPPKEACQFLIDLANLRGGPDNITVIIVRIKSGGKTKGKTSFRKKGLPWYQRVPWPIWILLLGVLLAGASFGLMYQQLQRAGGFAFTSAVVAIIIGLVGLAIYHKQRQEEPDPEPEYQPRTKIYREAECRIDDALVAKLSKAEETLVHRAREAQWEVDWKTQQKHHALSEKARGQGDFNGAFRELCQAMRPLTEALRKTRHKEEAFNPHWDKTES